MLETCHTRLAPTLCVLVLSLVISACSGSDGTATPPSNGSDNSGPGWSLNGDPGEGDMQSYPDGGEDSLDFGLPPQNNDASNNTTPAPSDMGPGFSDMGPGGPRDMAPVPVDMSPPTPGDMGGPVPVDMGGPGPGMDMGTPGQGGDGDVCGTTSECGAGLVCCPNFGSADTCTLENQCLVGGLCQTDAECPGQQTCCDYAQFGAPNVCSDRCRGGGGGGGNPGNMGCQNNSECSSGEVCCPNFSGTASCEPSNQCNTGGRCQMDTDCINGQSCCTFGGNGVCLNQCSF